MFHGIPHISMISSTREALKKKRLGIATSDLSLLGIIMRILVVDDGSQMRSMVLEYAHLHGNPKDCPNVCKYSSTMVRIWDIMGLVRKSSRKSPHGL